MDNLKQLQHTDSYMSEQFNALGNRALTDPNQSKPSDHKEVGKIDLKIRQDIVEEKLRYAEYHLDKFFASETKNKYPHWHGFLFELCGIFQDLIYYEIAHYYCFFYDLDLKNLKEKPRKAVQAIKKNLKTLDPKLDRYFVDFEKEPIYLEISGMRNYLIHNGLTTPLNRLTVGSPGGTVKSYLGFAGADIVGSDLLKTSGFYKEEHNSKEYQRQKAVTWYEFMVDFVDYVRQHALNHAPYYDPQIKKFTSHKSILFKNHPDFPNLNTH